METTEERSNVCIFWNMSPQVTELSMETKISLSNINFPTLSQGEK